MARTAIATSIAVGMPDAAGVQHMVTVAHGMGKPVFLGAFGVPDGPEAGQELADVLRPVEGPASTSPRCGSTTSPASPSGA